MINKINLFDLGITYAIDRRFNLTLSAPFLNADRSSPLRDARRNVLDRTMTEAQGLGDISLVGHYWVFNPDENPDGNLSFGMGVKFPTGEPDVMDETHNLAGVYRRVVVDQSIQPGDGGFGWIVDLNGFKKLIWDVSLYGSATYLFNPKDVNGVPTGRGRASEAEMSIADQYVARLGFSRPVVPDWGLSLSLGGRIEGVPNVDAIGDSNGFRRPGYAISIEPGIGWSGKSDSVNVLVPVALYRNRVRSVSDAEDDTHGDAAFADWFILVGYAHKF